MRGRRPAGPDYVDHVRDCDDETRRRLKAILGISPQRFHQMRHEALQGAADVLKPRPKGRPRRRRWPQQQQLEQLRQELGDAKIELRAAQARAEIATLLPRVLQAPPKAPPPPSAEEKKTRRR